MGRAADCVVQTERPVPVSFVSKEKTEQAVLVSAVDCRHGAAAFLWLYAYELSGIHGTISFVYIIIVYHWENIYVKTFFFELRSKKSDSNSSIGYLNGYNTSSDAGSLQILCLL